MNDEILAYLKDEVTPVFKPSVCNRLDRNTSGLVIAGKNIHALQAMNEIIRKRDVRKIYTALVYGEMKGKGKLEGYLKKDHEDNQVRLVKKSEDAQHIEILYEAEETYRKEGITFTRVEIELLTGRSHQIRVQMAGEGHPLLGIRSTGQRRASKRQGNLASKGRCFMQDCYHFLPLKKALRAFQKNPSARRFQKIWKNSFRNKYMECTYKRPCHARRHAGPFIYIASADDVFLVAFQVVLNIVEYKDGSSFHSFFRIKAYVRRKDGVRSREERMIGRKRRFAFKDVDACAGNFSFLQCIGKGFAVDDRASGGIDQDGILLHEGNLFLIDQSSCLIGQGTWIEMMSQVLRRVSRSV